MITRKVINGHEIAKASDNSLVDLGLISTPKDKRNIKFEQFKKGYTERDPQAYKLYLELMVPPEDYGLSYEEACCNSASVIKTKKIFIAGFPNLKSMDIYILLGLHLNKLLNTWNNPIVVGTWIRSGNVVVGVQGKCIDYKDELDQLPEGVHGVEINPKLAV